MSVIRRNIANKAHNIFNDVKLLKTSKILIPALFIIIGILILVTIILIVRIYAKKHEPSNEHLDMLFTEEYRLKTNEEKQQALIGLKCKAKKINFEAYDNDAWQCHMANSILSIDGLKFISREPSIEDNIKRIDSLIDLFEANL